MDAKYEVVTLPAPNQVEGSESDYRPGETRVDYIPGYALASNKIPQIKSAGIEGPPIACTIFLAITIDPSGNVTDVQENWMTIGPGDLLHDDLVKAVKGAVLNWKYVPARRAYWRVIDKDNKEYIRTETIEEVIIMKFSFSISGNTSTQAATAPAMVQQKPEK